MLPYMTAKEISCILMPKESQAMGIELTMYVFLYVCSRVLTCTSRYVPVYVESVRHRVSFLLLSALFFEIESLTEPGTH